jgi:hypothetical protein
MVITADFNTTYTFAVREAGTGLVTSTVTAGSGGDGARFPGGIADGNYLFEEGDTVSLTATDTTPGTGSEFQDWTVNSGNPGAGFGLTAKQSAATCRSRVISGEHGKSRPLQDRVASSIHWATRPDTMASTNPIRYWRTWTG